jgi:hypothetical protein
MNKHLIFAVALTVGAAMTLFAATEQDHVAWMKTAQKTGGNLKKAIEAKDADAATKDAKALVGTFKLIGEFYDDRHTADAVKMSKDGETAAGDVESAVAAKDFEKAGASLKAMMGSCGACHKAHREKNEDGTYKIK